MSQSPTLFYAFDRSFVWGGYLGAAVVLLIAMAWLTRRWQHTLRWLLLGLLALGVLIPASVPGHEELAPAFIVMAFGFMTKNVDAVAPVLVRFIAAALVLILLVAIDGIYRHSRRRRKAASPADQYPGGRDRRKPVNP